ncbi:MAG: lactate utilization protein [Dysgonamonadaceae bacterium]|jgi:L-lactate dehydrogenase complex protein LldG|nr:lactate utilization protein [Dysgonamonadaceae bacterium]
MSKQSILESIRQNKPDFQRETGKPEQKPVPVSKSQTTALKSFISALEATGGEVVECSAAEADSLISEKFPGILDFTRPEIREKYGEETPLSEFDKIETALLNGAFGVAENGAVWIEDRDMPRRIIPFIAQHLVLKTEASQIVGTMQEAYRRINLSGTGYGVFIAGPSKTADIEQSLVYGAHGAVRLTVVIPKMPDFEA